MIQQKFSKIVDDSGIFRLTWIINNICTQHCDYCPSYLNSGKNHHYQCFKMCLIVRSCVCVFRYLLCPICALPFVFEKRTLNYALCCNIHCCFHAQVSTHKQQRNIPPHWFTPKNTAMFAYCNVLDAIHTDIHVFCIINLILCISQ